MAVKIVLIKLINGKKKLAQNTTFKLKITARLAVTVTNVTN